MISWQIHGEINLGILYIFSVVMQAFIAIVSIHKLIKNTKMETKKQKKESVELTQREAFVQNAVRKGKENFPAPQYPGQFIDRETRVSIAIKKNPLIAGKQKTDDGALQPAEKTVLTIAIDLFKAPEHLVALLEKKEGFGALTSEQAQELWKVRKNYHYGYETTVDKTYADQVITIIEKK